jgi:pfkB family carbohydrate kinase
MVAALQLDYLTVGHVTVDVLEDGTRQPGGSAFYSALQAARLGLRTQILTCGAAEEIEDLLAPYAGELSLRVLPAAQTTVLATSGEGAKRRQRLLAWAGRLPEELRLESEIVHLAPVVRELPERWHGAWRLLGLTPQGLVREWSPTGAPEPRPGTELALPSLPARAHPEPPHAERRLADSERMRRLGTVCDAIVLSELERAACSELIAGARAREALVVITAGPGPVTLHTGAVTEQLAVIPLRGGSAASDMGAGDVFAAALFAELAGGSEPRAAVEFAAAAAAVRMRSPGAEAIADRGAIERYMRAPPRSEA